jgi:hypothetical protein
MIVRKDTLLKINKADDNLEVKIPDNIGIHDFVVCMFILLFIVRFRDPKTMVKVFERHLNG